MCFIAELAASREIRIHDHTCTAYSLHTAIYWNRTSDSTKTNNHDNIRSMLVVTSVHAQSARSSHVCGHAVCVCVGLIQSAERNERQTIFHYPIACRFCVDCANAHPTACDQKYVCNRARFNFWKLKFRSDDPREMFFELTFGTHSAAHNRLSITHLEFASMLVAIRLAPTLAYLFLLIARCTLYNEYWISQLIWDGDEPDAIRFIVPLHTSQLKQLHTACVLRLIVSLDLGCRMRYESSSITY